jgi:hypothetical protein
VACPSPRNPRQPFSKPRTQRALRDRRSSFGNNQVGIADVTRLQRFRQFRPVTFLVFLPLSTSMNSAMSALGQNLSRFSRLLIFSKKEMVLPDRIELSTSPLPMECSTTELRQHARYLRGIGPDGRPLGGRFLPQGPRWRKHVGRPERARNRQKSALVAGKVLQSGPTARPNRFPTIRGHQDPKRRIMTLHGLAAPVAGHCGEGRRNPLCSDGSVAGCMGPAWTKAYSADGR